MTPIRLPDDRAAYFLRGDSYLRYEETDAIDGGYPKLIAVGWTGLTDAGFDHDVDTVHALGDGKAYLFKDDEFWGPPDHEPDGRRHLRYDTETKAVDTGYPLPTAEAWPGFDTIGFGVRLYGAWLRSAPAEGIE